jgi:4-amino-4-deoxy-L-arabinose transferase-like glycosyltransferase
MKVFKRYWHLILLGLLSFFIFSFKLQSAASFEGDLGRDLYEIAKISLGNFTLLGPKGSFGGIYTAPYHYYLFAAPFLLVGKQLSGVLFFNVILFTFSLLFFSFHVSKKFGKLTGFLSGLVMMLMPFFIFSARNPGNGFTPTAFFLFFLTINYFYDINKFGLVKTLLLGFLFGLILSMLFAYVIVFVPILIFVFLLLKKKGKFLIFLAGLFFAFSPLVLFELKNHFVMLKNTFVDKSYLSFVNNTNLPGGVKLNKNIFANSLDLINKMQSYFGINVYLVFIFLLSALSWVRRYKERLLISMTGISFVILAFLLRFQYSGHYLLPFLTLCVFCSLIIASMSKYKIYLLTTAVIFLGIYFPKSYYTPSLRNYSTIRQRVEKTLAKNLIAKDDKFNVILKRADDAPTPAGNEYRFFFLVNGYEPQSDFLYKDSQKLIIFSEENAVDFANFKTWEMNEFDYSKVKSTKIFMTDPKMFVFVLEK